MRALVSDLRPVSVTGEHDRCGIKFLEQPAFYRVDDRMEVAAFEVCRTGATWEQGVATQQDRSALDREADRAGVEAPLHMAVYRLIKGREASWTFKDENRAVTPYPRD